MVKACGDNVLVKVKHEEEVSQGGIILAKVKEERFYEGVVVNCGTHPDIAEFGVKEGSYVYYEKGTNHEILQDGELYDIVSIYDIVAVGE